MLEENGGVGEGCHDQEHITIICLFSISHFRWNDSSQNFAGRVQEARQVDRNDLYIYI
jgi:hypothetical protein